MGPCLRYEIAEVTRRQRSIYGMLGVRRTGCLSSICEGGSGDADGALARGLPAKGLLFIVRVDVLDSVRRCARCICGMLLLDARVGRSPFRGSSVVTSTVSDLLKLPNLLGGGGREPDGRGFSDRRSLRYCAVGVLGELTSSSGVMHCRNFDALGGVCGRTKGAEGDIGRVADPFHLSRRTADLEAVYCLVCSTS